ncbi:DUF7848 domain-containing protein [Streptomyces sp. WMMC1477]|uniref:DUF7848 domain-containing protein n=1 Tax=unclassified Streptomyces TaxID=2593676 RepID=UPI003FCCB4CA
MNPSTRGFTPVSSQLDSSKPRLAKAHCVECGETGPTVEATKEKTPEAQGRAALEAQKVAGSWVEAHHKEAREHRTFRMLVGLPYRLVPGEWR